MKTTALLPALIASFVAAAPVTGYCGRHHDHDHDDHHHDYDDHHHYYQSYRSYGYSDPYCYNRPYYYGPTFGFSYYSRPSYSYRGYSANYGSDSLAVDVQRALRRHGYYRGPVDGDIGPGSRSAIRAYQADHRLFVTGRIDTALLRALGIG